MERMVSTVDSEDVTKVSMLGDAAIGTIEAGDDQRERLEEFTARVSSGEFHIATSETIPSACIDGRCGCEPRPNAAGGTNSLVVAVDLTNGTDENYLATYHQVLSHLKKDNHPVGGHDDDHSGSEKSGCGACDRLAQIYDFIASRGDVIREKAASLGVSTSDELHATIIKNATVRQDFATGPSIRDALVAEDGHIDHLHGEHKEVVAVINTKPGTTLDRDALEAEFGPNYEAFNVDVWSFPNAAEILNELDDSSTIENKIAAMVYYNLATAHVLCGPTMRVVVL